jgi:hypothetical protein
MIRKINKKSILYVLVAVCFMLVFSVFTIKPTYANTLKDEKAPCESCRYIGFQTVCNDYHCNQSSSYKHGQYFRYQCRDICLGYAWVEVYFDSCITVCY